MLLKIWYVKIGTSFVKRRGQTKCVSAIFQTPIYDDVQTKERSYLCDLCPSVFTSKAGLSDHVKSVHLGEKRFSCEKCGKQVRPMPKILYTANKNICFSFFAKTNCCSTWTVMRRRKCTSVTFVVSLPHRQNDLFLVAQKASRLALFSLSKRPKVVRLFPI